MKKIILATVLMVAPLAANAEDNVYLNLGGFSKHFKERKGNKDYNEVHNNIGLEYEHSLEDIYSKKWYAGAVVQTMENSVDNNSVMFGGTLKRRWKIDMDSNIAVGMIAGAQTGYPKAGERSKSDLVPVAYPTLEYNYNRVGVYGTCVPEVYSSGFCFVGFKLRVASFDY